MNRDDASVLDMLRHSRKLTNVASHLTLEELDGFSDTYMIVWANLMHLGEASIRVSESYKNEHPEIQWAKLRGLRNRLVHNYDEVDFGTLYGIVKIEIPLLLAALKPLAIEFPND